MSGVGIVFLVEPGVLVHKGVGSRARKLAQRAAGVGPEVAQRCGHLIAGRDGVVVMAFLVHARGALEFFPALSQRAGLRALPARQLDLDVDVDVHFRHLAAAAREFAELHLGLQMPARLGEAPLALAALRVELASDVGCARAGDVIKNIARLEMQVARRRRLGDQRGGSARGERADNNEGGKQANGNFFASP